MLMVGSGEVIADSYGSYLWIYYVVTQKSVGGIMQDLPLQTWPND